MKRILTALAIGILSTSAFAADLPGVITKAPRFPTAIRAPNAGCITALTRSVRPLRYRMPR